MLIGCSLRVAAGVTRCLRLTAMRRRTRTWVWSLAAENWRCNPCLALLCLLGEPDSKSRYK